MLGYDISWAAFNIIEVMSSSKFTFKVPFNNLKFDIPFNISIGCWNSIVIPHVCTVEEPVCNSGDEIFPGCS